MMIPLSSFAGPKRHCLCAVAWVCLCGKGYFGRSSGALDWGESMGVALIWSSFWSGKMWDFCHIWNAGQVLETRLGFPYTSKACCPATPV